VIQVASNHERDDGLSPLQGNRDLRWIATAFESAQAQRLRTGEQIRVLVESGGRANRSGGRGNDVEAVLSRIRSGSVPAPLAALGESYRREWNEERELLRLLSERVARHPAWPWLERVRGIGPSLAARLLARLEIDRAPTPSSFWSYCGLATVAADVYRCAECGYELSLPSGRHVRNAHRVPGSSQPCGGTLVPLGDGARRVAQPRPNRGEDAPYDREAKKLCYLIGISFVRQGDAYKRYYNEQRARLEVAKPDWIPRRRHLTALRMTEKLFLAHLWLVWREELGLPVTAPYADARDDSPPAPRPWAMVGG
jgi:transposase IS116/IS110/IS902 family protein